MITATCQGLPVMIACPAAPLTTTAPLPEEPPLVVDPAVPDSAADAHAKQGWIKFGEPHFDAGPKASVRRAIQPVPGTLVLFPSYMWHGTVPFRSSESRTTIAFDVVPR